MANIHTLMNSKIGTFTVKSRTKNERGNRARFICECDCGNVAVIFADELITEKFSHCKCASNCTVLDIEEKAVDSDTVEVEKTVGVKEDQSIELSETVETIVIEKVAEVKAAEVVESAVK